MLSAALWRHVGNHAFQHLEPDHNVGDAHERQHEVEHLEGHAAQGRGAEKRDAVGGLPLINITKKSVAMMIAAGTIIFCLLSFILLVHPVRILILQNRHQGQHVN